MLGDPRNDENLMHRRPARGARALLQPGASTTSPTSTSSAFPAAAAVGRDGLATRWASTWSPAQITLWHYQWLLVHEHLPQICGQDLVDDVLRNGARFYRPAAGARAAAGGVQRRGLPLRAQHGPALLPGQLHQRRPGQRQPGRRTRSSRWSSTRTSRPTARSTTTGTTCSAATRPTAATSAGRPSSTSATARPSPTSGSTPRSPACCSPSRPAPSRRAARPTCWCCRSATCCGT